MKTKHSLYALKTLLATLCGCVGLIGQVNAGLMITQTATDPSVGNFTRITPTGDSLSTYSMPDGDIRFWYGNNTSNALIGLPNTNTAFNNDLGWWDSSYSIFTTGVPSQSSTIWIDLTDVNAYGFAFQIGANQNATGWFDVYYADMTESISRHNIQIGRNNSPGFQVGNSGGSCQRIDKIRVDPTFVWGIFNMGVDTSGGGCATVPEPDSAGLFMAGALGLVLLRRRNSARLSVKN